MKKGWWSETGFDNEARTAAEIIAALAPPSAEAVEHGARSATPLDVEHRIRSLTDPIRKALWECEREKAALLLCVELLEAERG